MTERERVAYRDKLHKAERLLKEAHLLYPLADFVDCAIDDVQWELTLSGWALNKETHG